MVIGVEPGSRASETRALSIELRRRFIQSAGAQGIEPCPVDLESTWQPAPDPYARCASGVRTPNRPFRKGQRHPVAPRRRAESRGLEPQPLSGGRTALQAGHRPARCLLSMGPDGPTRTDNRLAPNEKLCQLSYTRMLPHERRRETDSNRCARMDADEFSRLAGAPVPPHSPVRCQ